MMRNHEVTKRRQLLNADGTLAEPGWSKSLVQEYSRRDIKAPKFRIKEWDYYLVLCDDYAVAFTLSDAGYIGMQSVTLMDFKNDWRHTETILDAFPMGKLQLPPTSVTGDIHYENKRLKIRFLNSGEKRRIICSFKNFKDGKDFECDITLHEPPMDSMVIATPWKESEKAFYYNQKINCMRAEGSAFFDGREFTFNPETDFGILDWGRGVWTYSNRWYWGSGNAVVNGKPFGFNIGYGFGNTGAASENMIFYDGKAHKLDDVSFNIPSDDYMKPWTFTSSDGRFEMEFVPVMDRADKISAVVIETDQHQVFGRMSGTAILDDGTKLEIKDVMSFAEDVYMKY